MVSTAELHKACGRGKSKRVSKLLSAGADIHAVDNFGYTALHWAADSGDAATVSLLLDQGALINKVADCYGDTPLLIAAKLKSTDIVRLLLDRGADVHARDNNGCSALYWATWKNNTKLAETLLSAGFNVNTDETRQEKLLHLACIKDHYEMAMFLIDAGLEIDAVNYKGKTPLYEATKHDHHTLARALIAKTRRTDLIGDLRISPEAIDDLWARKLPVETLRQFAVAMYIRVPSRVTPKKRSLMLESLLSAGLDPDAADKHGNTLLHDLCRVNTPERDFDIVLGCCNASTLNSRNRKGFTPLHSYLMECTYPNIHRLEQLLEAGADPSIEDDCGRNPLQLLYERDIPHVDEMATCLLANGCPQVERATDKELIGMGDLAESCGHGDYDRVKDLLARGVDANSIQSGYTSPLHYAMLYVKGTDGEFDEITAIVKALLTAGADVNAKDFRGCTPLHYAVLRGLSSDGQYLSTEVAHILVEHGADLDARSNLGKSPLQYPGSKRLNTGDPYFLLNLILHGNRPDLLGQIHMNLEKLTMLVSKGLSADTLTKFVSDIYKQRPKGVSNGERYQMLAAVLQAGLDPNDRRSEFVVKIQT